MSGSTFVPQRGQHRLTAPALPLPLGGPDHRRIGSAPRPVRPGRRVELAGRDGGEEGPADRRVDGEGADALTGGHALSDALMTADALASALVAHDHRLPSPRASRVMLYKSSLPSHESPLVPTHMRSGGFSAMMA